MTAAEEANARPRVSPRGWLLPAPGATSPEKPQSPSRSRSRLYPPEGGGGVGHAGDE